MALPNQYFFKKRATAIAIVVSGSSLGKNGATFSRNFTENYNFGKHTKNGPPLKLHIRMHQIDPPRGGDLCVDLI